jgi:hypothetical protein
MSGNETAYCETKIKQTREIRKQHLTNASPYIYIYHIIRSQKYGRLKRELSMMVEIITQLLNRARKERKQISRPNLSIPKGKKQKQIQNHDKTKKQNR